MNKTKTKKSSKSIERQWEEQNRDIVVISPKRTKGAPKKRPPAHKLKRGI